MEAIALAVDDVEQAFRQLEFAIKLMCYCEQDHLDRAVFDTDVTLLLENENVGFPTGSFANLESVVAASQVQVGVSFGVSAIVLDAGYEAAGVQKNLQSRSPSDDLRTFVYMVRCAFAHNIAAPCWQVRGKDFERTFSLPVEGSIATVDLSALNGQPFEYSHIGGFAQWFKVKKAVVHAINGT
jgi:hypothetical protein